MVAARPQPLVLGEGVISDGDGVEPGVLASTTRPSVAASPTYQAEGSEVKLVGRIDEHLGHAR